MNKTLSTGVAALALVAGCGKSPTAPPAAVSLVISPAVDLIRIKASESFTVTASGNGAPRAIAASWSSDNPAIASVDVSGRVTANTSGRATLTAAAEGVRATHTLRVVPDYQGQWDGVTRVVACTADGDFQGACDGIVGGGPRIRLSFTQDRDAVSGEVDFDGAHGPVSTSIQIDGRLVMTSTLSLTIEEITFDVALAEWDAASTDNQRMAGRFRLEIRHPRLAGSWTLNGELATLLKTSQSSVSSQGGSGASVVVGALRSVLRRRR
jgi:hypothetical protein